MAGRVHADDFNEKVLNADKPVLVEFYSDSCIPCKKIAGILGDLEEEYENKIDILKVNVTYEEELVRTYEVMSSPTILLFYKGTVENRVTGAVKKEVLIDLLKHFIYPNQGSFPLL